MTRVVLASYMCIVMDSDTDKSAEYCKIVKVNPALVSEVIEIGNTAVRCPCGLYDEVLSFLLRKKIVLTEKVKTYKSRVFKKFEIVCHDEELYAVPTFFLRTKVNKMIMSNGNQYYVLSD
jgi:hypothetical protein